MLCIPVSQDPSHEKLQSISLLRSDILRLRKPFTQQKETPQKTRPWEVFSRQFGCMEVKLGEQSREIPLVDIVEIHAGKGVVCIRQCGCDVPHSHVMLQSLSLSLSLHMQHVRWVLYRCCPCILSSPRNSIFPKPQFPNPRYTDHQMLVHMLWAMQSEYNRIPFGDHPLKFELWREN